MKKIILLPAVVLLLAGCAAGGDHDSTIKNVPAPSGVYTDEEEFHKTMENGDVVRCLRDDYANAISCDWDHLVKKGDN